MIADWKSLLRTWVPWLLAAVGIGGCIATSSIRPGYFDYTPIELWDRDSIIRTISMSLTYPLLVRFSKWLISKSADSGFSQDISRLRLASIGFTLLLLCGSLGSDLALKTYNEPHDMHCGPPSIGSISWAVNDEKILFTFSQYCMGTLQRQDYSISTSGDHVERLAKGQDTSAKLPVPENSIVPASNPIIGVWPHWGMLFIRTLLVDRLVWWNGYESLYPYTYKNIALVGVAIARVGLIIGLVLTLPLLFSQRHIPKTWLLALMILAMTILFGMGLFS